MYSFAKLKNDCRIILFISSYYLQFLFVPLIFVVELLSGFRDAFDEAYYTCKRAYYEHRMHYKGIDMTISKCYSVDEENFNHESLSELIEDSDLQVGSTYWEADAIPIKHSDNIHVCNILEYMDERLYDEVGEIADCDYSNVTHEAELELQDLMQAWAEKHVKLRYWKVRNAKEMKVQPEDLE